MSVTVTILGCGSSGGVPRVGQGWGACDPSNPKNRRRRCSLLVERHGAEGTTTVLVDTSPDLREQLLAAGTTRLDGIILTHAHADHTHGIDDVRPLVMRMRRRIDLHMDAATSAVVRNAFGYIFETPPGSGYPPLLTERRSVAGEPIAIEGPGGTVSADPFRVEHGEIDALGLRFGALAYSPDLSAIPPEGFAALRGLDVWIIDALRYTEHPSHITVAQALAYIDEVKPRRAILTNLHTDLDFATLARDLPAGVEPAYDGLTVTLEA